MRGLKVSKEINKTPVCPFRHSSRRGWTSIGSVLPHGRAWSLWSWNAPRAFSVAKKDESLFGSRTQARLADRINRMKPTITAFANSPDEGQGMARDMRVRWALEEVGQPYDVLYRPIGELKKPAYLALQPFGQIPAYMEGDLVIFETGSIVLHIAQTRPGLLPHEPTARARAITWMFAALSTIEPPIIARESELLFEKDKPWTKERKPIIDQRVRDRLKPLSAQLGDADWLDGEFSAGDLMMIEVLKRLEGGELVEEFQNLATYVARGLARPAFKRAFAAQRKAFEETCEVRKAGTE